MRVGIMQPYFLPYIGYFQLIGSCDLFVLHDDVKYTKKGWITRNRLQESGTVRVFSLSVRGDSDFLKIRERFLSQDFDTERLIRVISGAYLKSPYFEELLPVLRRCVLQESTNLVDYLHHSLDQICEFLEIRTPIIRSSSLSLSSDLRGQERVISMCKELGASEYLNPIGGLGLYDEHAFASRGIELAFIRSKLTPYAQGEHSFVEALSIVDCISHKGRLGVIDDVRNDFTLTRAVAP